MFPGELQGTAESTCINGTTYPQISHVKFPLYNWKNEEEEILRKMCLWEKEEPFLQDPSNCSTNQNLYSSYSTSNFKSRELDGRGKGQQVQRSRGSLHRLCKKE